MASWNKFTILALDLLNGLHDFDTHSFKIMLTNSAPSAANTTRTDITQITAANGYTAGGTATSLTTSISSGTAKVVATDVTFTASGGTMGTFRYAVLYNATNDALLGWYDYASGVSLASGDQFVVDYDPTNGLLTLTVTG